MDQSRDSFRSTRLDHPGYLLSLSLRPWIFCAQKKVQREKKTLILLEILIGLSLIALIFSLLFTSITHVAKVEKRVDQARGTLLARNHVQMRLQDLFLSLSSDAPFYTQKFPEEVLESLVLSFDNGIDPDPAFSGKVESRLYLDEEKNLSLVIWPIDEKTSWRKETLLSNVSQFQFHFFGDKNIEDGAEISKHSLTWHKRWSKERKEPPILIRLEVQQKTGPTFFAFFLPTTKLPTYQEQGGLLL